MILRILLCLGILVYASALDWKYREINDRSWVTPLILGLIFLIHDCLVNEVGRMFIIRMYFISLGVAIVLALFLYYTGLMGGGDGKMLIGIASMFPYFPTKVFSIFPLFVLSVFSNSVVISSFIPLSFFIYNLKKKVKPSNAREFFMMFLGYKRKSSEIGQFEVVMDKILMKASDIEFGKREVEGGEVWVTPALPFLIPITLGFVVSLLFGDIISIVVVKFLGN